LAAFLDTKRAGSVDGSVALYPLATNEVQIALEDAASAHEVLALLATPAPAAGTTWQPIETAPKDETPILGFVPSYHRGKGGISVILWMEGAWYDGRAFETEPTHWMPLPAPPALSRNDGEEEKTCS
jgi:hypothetical protein